MTTPSFWLPSTDHSVPVESSRRLQLVLGCVSAHHNLGLRRNGKSRLHDLIADRRALLIRCLMFLARAADIRVCLPKHELTKDILDVALHPECAVEEMFALLSGNHGYAVANVRDKAD